MWSTGGKVSSLRFFGDMKVYSSGLSLLKLSVAGNAPWMVCDRSIVSFLGMLMFIDMSPSVAFSCSKFMSLLFWFCYLSFKNGTGALLNAWCEVLTLVSTSLILRDEIGFLLLFVMSNYSEVPLYPCFLRGYYIFGVLLSRWIYLSVN